MLFYPLVPLQVIVFPYLPFSIILPWALLDVEVVTGRQASALNAASATSGIGTIKAVIKVVSKGGVVIKILAKIPFGTTVGAAVRAITGFAE